MLERLLLLSHLFSLSVVRGINVKEVEILRHLRDKKCLHGRLQQLLARRHFADGDRPGSRREGGGRREEGGGRRVRTLPEQSLSKGAVAVVNLDRLWGRK